MNVIDKGPEQMHRLAIKSPFNLYFDVIIPRSCYLSEPKVAKHFLFDGSEQPVYATELAYVITAGVSSPDSKVVLLPSFLTP